MNVQLSFDGRQVKPWSGVCHKACWFATQEKCVCRCTGKYHGRGLIQEKKCKGMKKDERRAENM